MNQEDLWSIPARTKWFFSFLAKEVGEINRSRHKKLCDLAYPYRYEERKFLATPSSGKLV